MASKVSFDKFYNVINGSPRGSSKSRQGVNPSTEEKLWDVPIPSEQDIEEAVAAANAAFKKWRLVPREEKNKLIEAFHEAFTRHIPELTELLVKENGKPAGFAGIELGAAQAQIKLHQQYTIPEHVVKDDEKQRIVTKYVPLGACVGILPWNFPILLLVTKAMAAVTAGNTIIIKPSPFTPYTGLKTVEIATSIFPPGVIQVLSDDNNNSIGPKLVQHPDIAKVSFTGSIPTGKKIMAAAARTLKRVTLELGGNDAAIVCDDVDIPSTAQMVAFATFANSGQICAATKRIYVHSKIYSDFMAAFVKVVKQFQPGTGFTGPIQNSMQYDKVKSIYDDCVAQKLDFVVGDGKMVKDKSGYFALPTVVAKPPETSRLVQEEPFGPIVPVLTWDDEADVIDRANDTVTGLASTVYSKDEDRAWRIAEGLEAGNVWINSGLGADPAAFFGGHKQSGIGGENGPLGLLQYCNAKTYVLTKPVPS